MNPIDLERLVDTELKRLPAPRAPRTLLPRVLAAVDAQQQHAKPAGGWAFWPRAWQFAGGVVMAAVLVGIWRLAAFAGPFISDLLPAVGLGRAAAFTRGADDAATVVRVLWEVLLQPVATYVSILAISLALACALFWTAVERLAPGGASQR
ncbi:MAG TPA: hypothetical protein VFT39_22745 [Vicinamibacterales bacterium]|nr:hypothetical protein [Vicinamibacterales bacterium]